MNVAQVTNQMLVEHFQVSIVDSIYAEDAKGRRKFLTDLRVQYLSDSKKAKSRKRANAKRREQVLEKCDDVFNVLRGAFTDDGYDVMIRETQPGLEYASANGSVFKVYCMCSATDGQHVMNIDSTEFDREQLESIFGNWSKHKREGNVGVTLNRLTIDEMINAIKIMETYHA